MEFCASSASALIFYGLQLLSLQNACLEPEFRRIKSAIWLQVYLLLCSVLCPLHTPIRENASVPRSIVDTVKVDEKRPLARDKSKPSPGGPRNYSDGDEFIQPTSISLRSLCARLCQMLGDVTQIRPIPAPWKSAL